MSTKHALSRFHYIMYELKFIKFDLELEGDRPLGASSIRQEYFLRGAQVRSSRVRISYAPVLRGSGHSHCSRWNSFTWGSLPAFGQSAHEDWARGSWWGQRELFWRPQTMASSRLSTSRCVLFSHFWIVLISPFRLCNRTNSSYYLWYILF